MSTWDRIISYHASMLRDRRRLDAYATAIREVVTPDSVVVDLGTGTGILAGLACRAGARRVYAIEAGPILHFARAMASANGYAERIQFLAGHSTEISIPERADIVLTETLGNAAFDEYIIQLTQDARKRFLKVGGTLVPRTVSLVASPMVRDQTIENRIGIWEEAPCGLDFSAVRRFASGTLFNVEIDTALLLAEAQPILSVDLRSAESLFVRGSHTFLAYRGGLVGGIGVWFDAALSPSSSISNSPSAEPSSWCQKLLPIDPPLRVSPGEEIRCEISSHNGHTWRWRGSVGAASFDCSNAAQTIEALAGRRKLGAS